MVPDPPDPPDPPDLAAVADALPAAEHACRQAERALTSGARPDELAPLLVRLLAAAAGDDAANAVRAHLEQPRPAAPHAPGPLPADEARRRVLAAALALHLAAEQALDGTLARSGLGRSAAGPRAGRAGHVARVLGARRALVAAVLGALAAPDPLDLPGPGSDWRRCLSA